MIKEKFRTDDEGYLLDPAEWSEAIAGELARREGQAQGLGAGARKRLFELFPYGYVKQACKIAGMRRPRVWSTG